MPPACQTKLILWPGSKVPLAISCYSSKGSGSMARWEPTGILFCINKQGTLPEWWRYNGNTLSSSPWSGPGGRQEIEKVWIGWSCWSSELRQSCRQRRWWDKTKKRTEAVFARCSKRGRGVFVNAFKCFATAEAVWCDLNWERRRQSKWTLLIFSPRIPPLHQPQLVFFVFFFRSGYIKRQRILMALLRFLFNCAICREEEKKTHNQGYPGKILNRMLRRIHS